MPYLLTYSPFSFVKPVLNEFCVSDKDCLACVGSDTETGYGQLICSQENSFLMSVTSSMYCSFIDLCNVSLMRLTTFMYMYYSCIHTRIPKIWVPTWFDTNQLVQSQKHAISD